MYVIIHSYSTMGGYPDICPGLSNLGGPVLLEALRGGNVTRWVDKQKKKYIYH